MSTIHLSELNTLLSRNLHVQAKNADMKTKGCGSDSLKVGGMCFWQKRSVDALYVCVC